MLPGIRVLIIGNLVILTETEAADPVAQVFHREFRAAVIAAVQQVFPGGGVAAVGTDDTVLFCRLLGIQNSVMSQLAVLFLMDRPVVSFIDAGSFNAFLRVSNHILAVEVFVFGDRYPTIPFSHRIEIHGDAQLFHAAFLQIQNVPIQLRCGVLERTVLRQSRPVEKFPQAVPEIRNQTFRSIAVLLSRLIFFHQSGQFVFQRIMFVSPGR